MNKQERNIYRYHNGTKEVYADPIRLAGKLSSDYPEASSLEHDFKLLALSNQESLTALVRLAQYARKVFDLKEYTEENGVPEGVLDIEAIGIFIDFAAWMDRVKKNILEMQKTPLSTESESSETTSPTSSDVVCISTSNAS